MMIPREELILKLQLEMKVQIIKNQFHMNVDEGVLTLKRIDTAADMLTWIKDNGATITEPLGNSYRYEIDDKFIKTFHNDRTDGWVAVEIKQIISGGTNA